jgi:BirA family transcriptional regulator, biotin operon repressor / biotin---[acetyl-CoA-carboxylase] ligase
MWQLRNATLFLLKQLMQYDLSTIAETPGLASLEFRGETPSTNTLALEMAQDISRPLPLLVLTEQQTAGRGRGANVWWSANGSITCSLLVNGAIDSRLALVTGLGVCEALQEIYPVGLFSLKWPNDVYLNGKKMCGILVEVPAQTSQRIVLGLGLNINNTFVKAPLELRQRATSLSDVAGGSFDLTEVLVMVLHSILRRIAAFQRGVDFTSDFRKYCLLTGRTITVQQGNNCITGICHGILENGSLHVQTETGSHSITSGVITSFDN